MGRLSGDPLKPLHACMHVCQHFNAMQWFMSHLTCRLFEELWIPLVQDSFSRGSTVYTHLCGPDGKCLLHAAKLQPGLAKVPSNNAEKRQLLDTLLTLINNNQHNNPYGMPGQPAKPEASSSEQTVSAPAAGPSTPPPDAAPIASVLLPRKLVFDGTSIDKAGIPLLARVYLDGFDRFPPFIKFFPVPTQYSPLPDEFRPESEKAPEWENKTTMRQHWIRRRDLAYEICKQAYWLQQKVNAQALEYGRKKNLKTRGVSISLKAAASKVAGLLQHAMEANKKINQHPQTLVELNAMFKDLMQGKVDKMTVYEGKKTDIEATKPASLLQYWLCIASSSDLDAMVAELYA